MTARWTYVGIQSIPGMALLLVNYGAFTRTLVAYDDERPVVIRRLP